MSRTEVLGNWVISYYTQDLMENPRERAVGTLATILVGYESQLSGVVDLLYDRSSLDALLPSIIEREGNIPVSTVYMKRTAWPAHVSLCLNLSRDGEGWEMIGYYFFTREAVWEEWGWTRLTAHRRGMLLYHTKNELAALETYLNRGMIIAQATHGGHTITSPPSQTRDQARFWIEQRIADAETNWRETGQSSGERIIFTTTTTWPPTDSSG